MEVAELSLSPLMAPHIGRIKNGAQIGIRSDLSVLPRSALSEPAWRTLMRGMPPDYASGSNRAVKCRS